MDNSKDWAELKDTTIKSLEKVKDGNICNMYKQDFEGEVRMIESVEGVYISSQAQLQEMERLSECLQKVFANKDEELDIVEGDLVVVDNKQGDFYRAEVFDIFKEFGVEHGGILHVNLIDLADNNYIVDNVNCAKFPDSMQEKIQPLVTKYKLHLKDDDFHEFSGSCREDLSVKLRRILRIGDKVRVHFMGFIQKGCLPEVVISKMSGCGEIVVVNNLLQSQSQRVFTSTPLLEILPEDENVNRAVTGYDPKDESRVCALFQKQGFCKRKFCSKDHEKLNPDGWTSDKELVYTDSFNTLNLDEIPIRSDLIILVTSITDDCFNRFYGQILNLDQPSSVHLGTLEKLEQLMVKLAQDSKLICLQLLPALGQLLVVQHYGSFFRGRVIEIVEDASSSGVLVFCVDYGFEKLVDFENAWDIHPSLLHLPFQAVQFFYLDTGFCSIHPGFKLDATFLRLDAELNVEIELNDIL